MTLRLHRVFLYLILLLASCLITLFCVEIAYRGYVYIKKPVHSPSSIPDLGWELTPGAKVAENNIEGVPVKYLINLAGFRDRTSGPWDRWKSTDIKVAFIGDSITYGAGVEYENTYPNTVESIFNRAGLHFRIVNFGIDGSNTLQHLAILKQKVLPLNPNIVILGYFLNDIERRRTESLPDSINYFLRHFHFGTFLFGRVATALEYRRVLATTNQLNTEFDDVKRKLAYEGYAKLIIESYTKSVWEDQKRTIISMLEICQRNKIKFGVVIFPFEDQIAGGYPKSPQKLITEFLNKKGIPCLDMTLILEQYIDNKKLYLKNDNIHLNNTGHYIAGKAINEWLISEIQ